MSVSTESLPLLQRASAGPYTIRGASVGGVYTSLAVPEMGVLLDVGVSLPPFASLDHIFISHGHGDHFAGLPGLIGMRGLLHRKAPPKVYVPAAIATDVERVLESMSKLQRHALEAEVIAMEAGTEIQLRKDLWVRAFSTFHPVPSLGYVFFKRVNKLRPEFRGLDGADIARRRRAGEDLFEVAEHRELAYATDTLVSVLKHPDVHKARVLVLECTFLDERKELDVVHRTGHLRLDELLEASHVLENEVVVLMHFSRLYTPEQVRTVLREQCPSELYRKIRVLAPEGDQWAL